MSQEIDAERIEGKAEIGWGLSAGSKDAIGAMWLGRDCNAESALLSCNHLIHQIDIDWMSQAKPQALDIIKPRVFFRSTTHSHPDHLQKYLHIELQLRFSQPLPSLYSHLQNLSPAACFGCGYFWEAKCRKSMMGPSVEFLGFPPGCPSSPATKSVTWMTWGIWMTWMVASRSFPSAQTQSSWLCQSNLNLNGKALKCCAQGKGLFCWPVFDQVLQVRNRRAHSSRQFDRTETANFRMVR